MVFFFSEFQAGKICAFAKKLGNEFPKGLHKTKHEVRVWLVVRMALVLPEIKDNTDGWGPSSTPEQFEGLPYLPFSKSDKLSKVADWNAPGQFQNRYNRKIFQKIFKKIKKINFTHQKRDTNQLKFNQCFHFLVQMMEALH